MKSDESGTDRVAKKIRAVQDTLDQVGPAASASYTLVGAVLVLGALGYGFDRWQGTSPWGLVAGLFLGMAVGFYELINYTRK
jgi:F0F1-type ATP synthase assembly protein I